MTMARRRSRQPRGPQERGQALVVVVVGLIPALAMVALILDGGNAWVQQRITQTGADASAEAGATMLGQKLTGQTVPAGGWDQSVASAVATLAGSNDIAVPNAYYTDVCGTVLTTSFTAAKADYSDAAGVGSVGDAFLDQSGAVATPDCTLSQPRPGGEPAGRAAGVLAVGVRPFPTFIASVIGISTLTAQAEATAVTGPLQSGCSAETGTYCVVLPIAIWYTHYHCDDQSQFVDDSTSWVLDDGSRLSTTESTVPLCKGGSGDVGWIHWPDNPNNGMAGVCQSIREPDNPGITFPYWVESAKPGDSGGSCSDDLNTLYDGQTVLIPIYDLPCTGTVYPSPPTGPYPYGCVDPDDPVSRGAQGYFHVTQWAAFILDSFITGNSSGICGGNGSTDCLRGWFTGFVSGGNVGPGSGGTNTVVGVQLIR